ncbi:MAG: hypothetical protein M3P98_00680 [bacterium]|nr:hypothetical protein [bacterium]
MDPTSKQSVIDRISQANNILITVKNSPNVDQLAACIGATLFFNKLGKHTTAVFSGTVPSTLEFLKPNDTIEASTDSLRDFIISLDTDKADKIKWKVDKENGIVKIFITPYHTSISHDDLDFSHGDLNVDVLIGIGVESQTDIDQAITAHGRILHDATVITMNTSGQGNIGTLHLEDKTASSLCEMVVDLASSIKSGSYDEQMATAFLTGIVAETNRFSNEKTSPKTMQLAGELMTAGANQQLIATKLSPADVAGRASLRTSGEPGAEGEKAPTDSLNEINITHEEPVAGAETNTPSDRITEKPAYGGDLTATTRGELPEPSADILGEIKRGDTLEHGKSSLPADITLEEIENEVESPHRNIDQIERSVGSEHTTLQPLTPPKLSIPDSEAATASAGVPGGPSVGPIDVKPLDQPAGRESVDEALRAVQAAAENSPSPQITPPPPPAAPGLPSDENAPLPNPIAPMPPMPGQAPAMPPSNIAPITPESIAPGPPSAPLPPAPPAPMAPTPNQMQQGAPPPVPPPMMPPTL